MTRTTTRAGRASLGVVGAASVSRGLLMPSAPARFGRPRLVGSSERWSPVQSVEKILLSVVSMLAEPNDESGANIDASVRRRFPAAWPVSRTPLTAVRAAYAIDVPAAAENVANGPRAVQPHRPRHSAQVPWAVTVNSVALGPSRLYSSARAHVDCYTGTRRATAEASIAHSTLAWSPLRPRHRHRRRQRLLRWLLLRWGVRQRPRRLLRDLVVVVHEPALVDLEPARPPCHGLLDLATATGPAQRPIRHRVSDRARPRDVQRGSHAPRTLAVPTGSPPGARGTFRTCPGSSSTPTRPAASPCATAGPPP